MNNLSFQKIRPTITQIQYINVQQILVVTFKFTGAAGGFVIMSFEARGVKMVGQHCSRLFRIQVFLKQGECFIGSGGWTSLPIMHTCIPELVHSFSNYLHSLFHQRYLTGQRGGWRCYLRS